MKLKSKKAIIIIGVILIILISITMAFFIISHKSSQNNREIPEEIGSPENLKFSEEDLKILVDKINKLNNNFKEENYGDQAYETEYGITCVKYTGNNYKEIISTLSEVYSDPFITNGNFKNINAESDDGYLSICLPKICDIDEIKTYKIDNEEKSLNYIRVYLNDYAYEVMYENGNYQITAPVMLCKNNE